MPGQLVEDDDSPNWWERQQCAALAQFRFKELDCAVLRERAAEASQAWLTAEAQLAQLRLILEALDATEAAAEAGAEAETGAVHDAAVHDAAVHDAFDSPRRAAGARANRSGAASAA